MLHVSVITDHPQALNTYLKLKIKFLYIKFVRTHKFYATHTHNVYIYIYIYIYILF